jgi:hypothetical protein
MRIGEQRGGDGAAKIDVEAVPFSFAIRLGEPRQSGINATLQKALLEYRSSGRLPVCGAN